MLGGSAASACRRPSQASRFARHGRGRHRVVRVHLRAALPFVKGMATCTIGYPSRSVSEKKESRNKLYPGANRAGRPYRILLRNSAANLLVLLHRAVYEDVHGSRAVVRNFPGHKKDDVFVSTDPTLDPKYIIESYARRWSLEVTFHEAKSKLGFEDPCNRTERAVERTAPLALVSHTLVVLWYVKHGQRTSAARLPTLPWYTHKAGITFSDMLATLRRASWRQRLFDPASSPSELRKRLRPLVDYVASAA